MPRTKYTFLLPDEELEQKLAGRQREWLLYLHPSQRYVINLPMDYRVALSGSAGTGKTVCAWFRVQELSKQGVRVGFIAPNQSILEVWINKLTLPRAADHSHHYNHPRRGRQVAKPLQTPHKPLVPPYSAHLGTAAKPANAGPTAPETAHYAPAQAGG